MSSYKEIVKSTGVIAFVKIFTIAFGIIRAKAIALLVGTAGFGYYSIFTGFSEMFSTFSTLGVDQSGVREIAKSHNSGNEEEIATTRHAIKYTILFAAMISCIIAVIFSKWISEFLFGTDSYYVGVIIVTCGTLFNCVARGQMAVLNGLRQINRLAYCQIVGACTGSLGAVFFIYFIGEEGIPWAISLVAVALFLSTLYYEKKNKFIKKIITLPGYYCEIKKLLGLGLCLSLSGVIATVVANFSMIFIRKELGIDVVGLYQSSWTISNLYIGTILGAMGVDFLPRLMGIIDDKKIVVQKVNEQVEMGVLLGSIGVLFTFLFAPTILQVFYSGEFIDAGSIMRWHCFGIALRVIAWPLAFVITAKGQGLIFVCVQAAFHFLEYSFLVLFVKLYGLNGLGINYLIAYSCYLLMVYFVCRHLVGFSFNRFTKQLISISFLFLLLGVLTINVFSNISGLSVGMGLVLINCVWVNYILKSRMGIDVFTILKLKFLKN